MNKILFRKAPERSSLAIPREKANKLKDLTRLINEKIKSNITWSEFTKFIIDEYAEEAAKDLIYKAVEERKK